jgi:hypothetical protein
MFDDDEPLFEFTDLGPHLTGLPFYMWVQPRLGPRVGPRHGPQVGVSDNRDVARRDLILVVIRPQIRVVKGKMSKRNLVWLRRWLDLNRDLIIGYWNCDPMKMDSLDVYDAIKPLPRRDKFRRAAYERAAVRSEELLRALKPLSRPN